MTCLDSLPSIGLAQTKSAALRRYSLTRRFPRHTSRSQAYTCIWSGPVCFGSRVAAGHCPESQQRLAHQFYGYYLSALGRFDAAIAEMERALEIDPLRSEQAKFPRRDLLPGRSLRTKPYSTSVKCLTPTQTQKASSPDRCDLRAKENVERGHGRTADGLRLAAGRKSPCQSNESMAHPVTPRPKDPSMGGCPGGTEASEGCVPPTAALDIAADYAMLGERDKAFEWLDGPFARTRER